jgi:hypothetical protein
MAALVAWQTPPGRGYDGLGGRAWRHFFPMRPHAEKSTPHHRSSFRGREFGWRVRRQAAHRRQGKRNEGEERINGRPGKGREKLA